MMSLKKRLEIAQFGDEDSKWELRHDPDPRVLATLARYGGDRIRNYFVCSNSHWLALYTVAKYCSPLNRVWLREHEDPNVRRAVALYGSREDAKALLLDPDRHVRIAAMRRASPSAIRAYCDYLDPEELREARCRKESE